MGKEKGNDLTLKIFALIIAVILWSYVMSKEDPLFTATRKNVSVQFVNESSLERQGLVIMEPKDATITVSIEGRRSDVMKISEKDIIAKVDLTGYTEGNVKVSVDVESPSKLVDIVDYSPKEILFKFDKLVRKESPVTIETEGKLPQGFVLGAPEIKPQSVYIEGPRSWVNAVSQVIALVNIGNKTEDINITVPIKLVDSQGNDVRGVDKEQNVVDIFIPVYQIKKIPIELQTVNQLPDGYEIVTAKINPATIEVKGKKGALTDIKSIKTKPIDINSLISNRNVPVELDIPEGLTLVDPNQRITVTLNIDESVSKTFNYTLNDVKITNINPELYIDEEDFIKSFAVTIQGMKSIIDTLDREDISMEIDLEDLDEGNHIVSITVKAEEGVSIVSILPENFNITLKRE